MKGLSMRNQEPETKPQFRKTWNLRPAILTVVACVAAAAVAVAIPMLVISHNTSDDNSDGTTTCVFAPESSDGRIFLEPVRGDAEAGCQDARIVGYELDVHFNTYRGYNYAAPDFVLDDEGYVLMIRTEHHKVQTDGSEGTVWVEMHFPSKRLHFFNGVAGTSLPEAISYYNRVMTVLPPLEEILPLNAAALDELGREVSGNPGNNREVVISTRS